jgi:hypothetical protein
MGQAVSDDIPLIFADQLASPEAREPRIVFMSAVAASQMQQYVTAGWRVIAAPGFASKSPVDLAAVPAQAGDEAAGEGADIVSIEAPLWPGEGFARLSRWKPACVKVNCAFHGLESQRCEDMASMLNGLGYTLLGAHWRDDTYALASLSRLDYLAAFPGRDWKHLNLIAVRDAARARALTIVGRLYAGEERRIAELRVANAVRGDHIARLEDALMAHQKAG